MTPLLQQNSEIWERAKSELASSLPTEVFKTWFENVSCSGGDDSKIVLSTPSGLAPYWIKDNYFDVLTQNISMAAGRNISVELSVVQSASESQPVQRVAPLSSSERALPARKESVIAASINPRNTFENFVVGESNRFAHAAALAVAQNVGKAFNPLVLYGPTGLGKTHLMHAIAHFIIRNHPEYRIVYISSEAFVNDYINALSKGNISEFRRKYRSTDVLLIDDIQFFAGKKSSQEEFFHTFNDLFNINKQIVLTCDKHVKDVDDLEKRLESRFEWGTCIDIQSPDYETRLAILRSKVAAMGGAVTVGDNVLDFIARRFTKNVRRMEGALNKLLGYSSLMNSCEPVSLEKACVLLADDIVQEDGLGLDVELIQKKTAEAYKIETAELCGRRRTANIAQARQVAMYLCKNLTKHTLEEIGKRFGGRDHVTVIHAVKVVGDYIKTDIYVKGVVDRLMKELSA